MFVAVLSRGGPALWFDDNPPTHGCRRQASVGTVSSSFCRMAPKARPPSEADTSAPIAPKLVQWLWVAGGWAGVFYGVFLTITALRSPPGVPLTGQWAGQPIFKASMAVLLAMAAVAHPIVRERRWLMSAL